MKASKTSKQWMREHVNDPYVQLAQKDGYRSRAAYKLLELDERDHLIKPGMVVVDLGATPGGRCRRTPRSAHSVRALRRICESWRERRVRIED